MEDDDKNVNVPAEILVDEKSQFSHQSTQNNENNAKMQQNEANKMQQNNEDNKQYNSDNTELRQLTQMQSQPNNYVPTMYRKTYEDKISLFMQQINGKRIEYNVDEALVLFNIIEHININAEIKVIDEFNHVTNYNLRQGIEKFGKSGVKSARDEMSQLHYRTCFQPMHVHELTPEQRRKVLESLIFITEK